MVKMLLQCHRRNIGLLEQKRRARIELNKYKDYLDSKFFFRQKIFFITMAQYTYYQKGKYNQDILYANQIKQICPCTCNRNQLLAIDRHTWNAFSFGNKNTKKCLSSASYIIFIFHHPFKYFQIILFYYQFTILLLKPQAR